MSEWNEEGQVTYANACDTVLRIVNGSENAMVLGFQLHVHLLNPDGTIDIRDVEYGPDFPH